MNDGDLVELIATVWVKCGGDASGFDYLYKCIRDRIEDLR